MFRKHLLLTGIIISLLLLLIATWYYPGGSQQNKNSIGYSWKNNYLSNLFTPVAVNGADNAARYWAIPGMFFLCCGFALFFIQFSKKIPEKVAAAIIKYAGAIAMLVAFLAVTPLHDIAVTIAVTLGLISMFYITVFIFKSGLTLFKSLSVICLLCFYCCNYIYYTQNLLRYLPILQKTALGIVICWMICLQYFTSAADFKSKKEIAAHN